MTNAQRLRQAKALIRKAKKDLRFPASQRISLRIARLPGNFDIEATGQITKNNTVGATGATYPFKTIHIRISPVAWKKRYDGIERTVYHEMIHALGFALSRSEDTGNREEALAEHFAKLMLDK